jgi:dTDP-4-dehydrorhamnose 3,5-epimerase
MWYLPYESQGNLFYSDNGQISSLAGNRRWIMIVTETDIERLKINDIEPHRDNRGFFARAFCKEEFAKNNLESEIIQCNLSHNIQKGTLRGMHYQIPPHEEIKMVRCTKGTIFDVAVDLRENSPTYLKWRGFEIRADNYSMLYIPRGCAHGYQTLEDDTTVFYMVTEPFHPESERGIRWNDPTITIKWPLPVSFISDKDNNYSDFIP